MREKTPRLHPSQKLRCSLTVLTDEQKQNLRAFFRDCGKLLLEALVPGAHVCVAGHPVLQHHVQGALAEIGYEVRPAIMRLHFGFRGGDRPKNAEREFPEVCVTPKGAYEPWMLFRRPLGAKTVAENLRKWKTGGLRRLCADKPLPEVVPSGRAPKREEAIPDHPCLKPQHFMRIIVRALLPLGEGTVLGPFRIPSSALNRFPHSALRVQMVPHSTGFRIPRSAIGDPASRIQYPESAFPFPPCRSRHPGAGRVVSDVWGRETGIRFQRRSARGTRRSSTHDGVG